MVFSNQGNQAGVGSGKSGAATQPLPPLPDLPTSAGSGPSAGMTDPFQATMLRIKPVVDAVNSIHAAVKTIAQSGIIPGGGPLDQIVQLASMLVPIAAQHMLGPGMGGGALPPPSVPPSDLGTGGGGPPSPGPPPSSPGSM